MIAGRGPLPPRGVNLWVYMSCSLNSLEESYIGDYIGTMIGVTTGILSEYNPYTSPPCNPYSSYAFGQNEAPKILAQKPTQGKVFLI